MTTDGGATGPDDEPVVFVVDGEREVADRYARWLDGRWPVETAYDGAEALDRLDDDVGVVVLARELPGIHGDRLLGVVRERGLDCRVAMVTGVELDGELARLGFDACLVEPVGRRELIEATERLTLLARYDELVDRYFSLAARKAELTAPDAEGPATGADSSGGQADVSGDPPEVPELRRRLGRVRSSLDEVLADLAARDAYADLCLELSEGFPRSDHLVEP